MQGRGQQAAGLQAEGGAGCCLLLLLLLLLLLGVACCEVEECRREQAGKHLLLLLLRPLPFLRGATCSTWCTPKAEQVVHQLLLLL